MATKDFVDYMPHLLPSVPGCPEPLAINAVREAAIRLCEDSTIWREDMTAGDVVIDKDEYTITPNDLARVVSVIYLGFNGVTIFPKTEEYLDLHDDGWRNGSPGIPFAFVQLGPTRIKFNRIPDEAIVGGLTARVAVKPTVDATKAGDLLFFDWRTAIVAGAKEYLMGMPGKSWSDSVESIKQGRIFTFQISRARARAASGHSKAPTHFRLKQWV